MNAASAACLPPRSSPSSSRSLWRVSVAADEGAAVGPRGRQTKGGAKLCVYVQCRSSLPSVPCRWVLRDDEERADENKG